MNILNLKLENLFENSSIGRYNIVNPNFDEVDSNMRKFVNIHNKKYEKYDVRCFLKLLTTTNLVRYIRNKRESSLHYSIYITKRLILSRNINDQYYFSQRL